MSPPADATAWKRRAADHPAFRAVREFGLPTVFVLLLFWAWDRDRQAERSEWRSRDERTASAFVELRRSIDASTEASRLASSELRNVGERVGQLGERVNRLEQLGTRVMERRRITITTP